MSQIQACLSHVGRVGGSLGIAYPGHPLTGSLAFQKQLQSGTEVPPELTGKLDQSALDLFFTPIGHSST